MFTYQRYLIRSTSRRHSIWDDLCNNRSLPSRPQPNAKQTSDRCCSNDRCRPDVGPIHFWKLCHAFTITSGQRGPRSAMCAPGSNQNACDDESSSTEGLRVLRWRQYIFLLTCRSSSKHSWTQRAPQILLLGNFICWSHRVFRLKLLWTTRKHGSKRQDSVFWHQFTS